MLYSVRYVHRIHPNDSDVGGPVEIRDNAFSNKNTLAEALRNVGVLAKGEMLRSVRAEGDHVVAFPGNKWSIWHSVILTPVRSAYKRIVVMSDEDIQREIDAMKHRTGQHSLEERKRYDDLTNEKDERQHSGHWTLGPIANANRTGRPIVWAVSDLIEREEVAHFDRKEDAIKFARKANIGQPTGRFQVERSMIVGGRAV